MFKTIFGNQKALVERAKLLVPACKIIAVEAITPLSEKFQFLETIDREHWDFILTIAGVFLATTGLEQIGLTDKQKQPLLDEIAQCVDEWQRDGLRAFEDCKALFEKEFDFLTAQRHPQRFIGSDALGLWIVWNVLGHQPENEEELQFVRTVGVMVVGALFNYWQESPLAR